MAGGLARCAKVGADQLLLGVLQAGLQFADAFISTLLVLADASADLRDAGTQLCGLCLEVLGHFVSPGLMPGDKVAARHHRITP
ncbi:hypothetical protein D3C85_1589680 [compost metagenome]